MLLLIETSRAYGRGLVEGIARYAEEHGPWSIHFDERGLADRLPRWFKDWRGDGIIARTTHRADVARLLAAGPPVVELYPDPRSSPPGVHPDEEALARMAASHFFDRGLRHFGFFCTDDTFWVDLRRRAFEQLLWRHGHACQSFHFPPARTSTGKKPRSIDDRGVIRWLRAIPKPCGVFCATDFFAMRLARTCRDAGVAVPEEVAVLGVDDDPVFCGVCYPRLSSIDLGPTRIGYKAAALLDRMMAGKSPPSRGIRVDPLRVITRGSTDVLAIADPDVARAARLIREQACQRLRIAQVAEAVGLSRRVLEQRFQRALDRSPKAEILRLRMERAKMLLSTTDTAIATVAKASGFGSLEYFARAFRRAAGITPRAYRQEQRLPAPDNRRG